MNFITKSIELFITTGADDEEEKEYDPEDTVGDPEDHEVEDEEEPDDDDNGAGPSRGRKGKQLKAVARNKNNNNTKPKCTHVRVQQQEIVDDDGPIPVDRAAMQHAENLIINYNNDAEQLRQEALNRGGGPTRQGIDALVRLVVRHMIFSNTEKPGIPISRTEVTKLVAENSACFSKRPGLPSLIIAIAQAKLAECFGMEMVELIKPRFNTKDRIAGQPPTATPAPGEGTKHFVLRSIVPSGLYVATIAKRNCAASNAFLAVVLSIIDMAGGSIEETELWKHLGDLAVEKAEEHPHLGMPHDLMEEFIKKRQVHVERVAGNDGAELYYSIAENAVSEVGDEILKSFYQDEFS